MEEIRITDLNESFVLNDNDYILTEQIDGTKRIKGLVINKKIKDLETKVDEISYDFGSF